MLKTARAGGGGRGSRLPGRRRHRRRESPTTCVLAPLPRLSAAPVFCALNKVDRVRPKAPAAAAHRRAGARAQRVPGDRADLRRRRHQLRPAARRSWSARCPSTRRSFPADATSDQPETFYVAEVVREQIFHLTHEEVPYAVAVRVEELTERTRARAAVHPRHDLRRAGLAEGHPDRQGRGDAQAHRHRRATRAGGASSASRSSSSSPSQVRRQLAEGRPRAARVRLPADLLTWRSASRRPS